MLYFDLEPSLELLTNDQKGQLFTAIFEYAHHGIIPEFTDMLLALAWSFIKPSIDRDGMRYQNAVQQKRIAGIKSDFKRNYAPKNGINPDDEEEMQKYIHQRLSTSVDECRPPPTTTGETASKAFSTSSLESTSEATIDPVKKVDETKIDSLSESDYEKLKQDAIEALRLHP